MTNVVRATISYCESHGTDATTEWSVYLVGDKTLVGVITEIEENVYACVKADGAMIFFDADKVLYMRVR